MPQLISLGDHAPPRAGGDSTRPLHALPAELATLHQRVGYLEAYGRIKDEVTDHLAEIEGQIACMATLIGGLQGEIDGAVEASPDGLTTRDSSIQILERARGMLEKLNAQREVFLTYQGEVVGIPAELATIRERAEVLGDRLAGGLTLDQQDAIARRELFPKTHQQLAQMMLIPINQIKLHHLSRLGRFDAVVTRIIADGDGPDGPRGDGAGPGAGGGPGAGSDDAPGKHNHHSSPGGGSPDAGSAGGAGAGVSTHGAGAGTGPADGGEFDVMALASKSDGPTIAATKPNQNTRHSGTNGTEQVSARRARRDSRRAKAWEGRDVPQEQASQDKNVAKQRSGGNENVPTFHRDRLTAERRAQAGTMELSATLATNGTTARFSSVAVSTKVR